jgi:mono/diheme cytochrome c family protein
MTPPRSFPLVLCLLFAPGLAAAADKDVKPDLAGFRKVVTPFLKQNCFHCHGPEEMKGDLTLHDLEGDLTGESGAVTVWKVVLARLVAGEMPPEDEPRPDDADTKKVIAWIRAEVGKSERKK